MQRENANLRAIVKQLRAETADLRKSQQVSSPSPSNTVSCTEAASDASHDEVPMDVQPAAKPTKKRALEQLANNEDTDFKTQVKNTLNEIKKALKAVVESIAVLDSRVTKIEADQVKALQSAEATPAQVIPKVRIVQKVATCSVSQERAFEGPTNDGFLVRIEYGRRRLMSTEAIEGPVLSRVGAVDRIPRLANSWWTTAWIKATAGVEASGNVGLLAAGVRQPGAAWILHGLCWCDDDVAVCSAVSLDDIIETVRPDTAGTSDEEEIDDTTEASASVPTYADVLCYVDNIRRFACARDKIGDLLPDVAAIKRKLMHRG
ncbi:hypothetical protein HPB51_021559 [Rhipicephalus microplus]|uniref:Uncharacterized protein n=1 Tax=Rhipicephalus microplus TaxID=6941 RepID=A0A9J6EI81_RHIMP|nr:hypothetical protein HPB51_021559 [Rhipicephalus microplus]